MSNMPNISPGELGIIHTKKIKINYKFGPINCG